MLRMLPLIFIILVTLSFCECVFVTSSFWAPVFNPKILNYRVDIPMNPDAGKNARDDYIKNYGVRGEKLIASLGNGKGPTGREKSNEDIKFYYTYPGAKKNDNIMNIVLNDIPSS